MSAENPQEKTPSGGPSSSSNDKKEDDSMFECNICLDTAKDAVVSMCGHLFCWPCLSQWLETRPSNSVCPVCKSAIDSTKVVPIYGRGGNSTDPRQKVPPRPKGHRTEAQSNSFPGFHWGGVDGAGNVGGNVQFSFGIGIFPLSFVASLFNTIPFGGDGGNGGQQQQQQQQQQYRTASSGSRRSEEEEFLKDIFKYIGILMLVWLIFL